jgi:hypothetical protein
MDNYIDFRAAYKVKHEIAELETELANVEEMMGSYLESIHFIQNCQGVGVGKLLYERKARYLVLHDRSVVIREKLEQKND